MSLLLLASGRCEQHDMIVSPLDVAWWCNALGSLATVLVMFVAILCSNWDRLAREHAEELAGIADGRGEAHTGSGEWAQSPRAACPIPGRPGPAPPLAAGPPATCPAGSARSSAHAVPGMLNSSRSLI